MKRALLFMIIALTAWLPSLCMAQNGKYSVSALVQDQQGTAVEYATVVFLQDGKQQAGTITDEKGCFIQQLPQGSYEMVVQFLGYETIRKSIALNQSIRDTLVMKSSDVKLSEVVVKAHQIERKADRFVVMVPPTLSKDGAQLVSESPGVWLSDDGISINGASGTKVFVDDKEIKLQGEELVNYIRALRSENIKKIEVIPVSGAEYDANSKGGIILISLRNRLDDGVNGTVTMGSSFESNYVRYEPSMSLNGHVGKWNFNGSSSIRFNPKNHQTMDAYRLYPDNSTNYDSHTDFHIHGNYGTARLAVVYDMDSLNSIGAEYEWISQASDNKSYSTTDIALSDGAMKTNGIYNQHDDYGIHSGTVNWIHRFDDKGSQLKAIGTYVHKHSAGDNNYQTTWSSDSFSKDSLYRNQASVYYDIATGELALNTVFSKRTSLKTGLKYMYTLMDDKSNYEGSYQGNWQTIPDYGYTMRYNENIAAAYASLNMEMGMFSAVAGLRTEYTRTSNQTEHFNRDYFDFFPNVTASYAFDPIRKWILNAQYARNIERPAFYTLNPNRIQSSDYTYSIGNPYLKPTYIDNISLTLVYNYRYTLTLGTSLHHNLIREYAYKDKVDSDIYYVTYENHNRENHTFVALNLPFQPFRWLNFTVNYIQVLQQIKMNEQSKYKNHQLSFVKANAAFRLSENSSIEANYDFSSRLYSGNSGIEPRHTFDLLWRQKFMSNKWVLTAAIDNLFDHHYGYFCKLDDYTEQSHFENQAYGRLFKISLTWNFNAGKSGKKHQIDRGMNGEMKRLTEDNKK